MALRIHSVARSLRVNCVTMIAIIAKPYGFVYIYIYISHIPMMTTWILFLSSSSDEVPSLVSFGRLHRTLLGLLLRIPDSEGAGPCHMSGASYVSWSGVDSWNSKVPPFYTTPILKEGTNPPNSAGFGPCFRLGVVEKEVSQKPMIDRDPCSGDPPNPQHPERNPTGSKRPE